MERGLIVGYEARSDIARCETDENLLGWRTAAPALGPDLEATGRPGGRRGRTTVTAVDRT